MLFRSFSKVWYQSRYDRGEGADYINCPLDRAQYDAFIAALLAGETAAFKEWERDIPYFEGCLPIEVMAERGPATLAYGPMKPVGLTNPATGRRPYAVVQLRQDDLAADHFSLVGFQTQLKWGEQRRVLRLIPGLANAEFVRFGMIHRNTYINAPTVLRATWQTLALSFFAGAGLVGLYTLYQMARGGLLRRRYRKELMGLETEVHQLRNLPLAPEENAPEVDDIDFEGGLSPARGGKGATGR